MNDGGIEANEGNDGYHGAHEPTEVVIHEADFGMPPLYPGQYDHYGMASENPDDSDSHHGPQLHTYDHPYYHAYTHPESYEH